MGSQLKAARDYASVSGVAAGGVRSRWSICPLLHRSLLAS